MRGRIAAAVLIATAFVGCSDEPTEEDAGVVAADALSPPDAEAPEVGFEDARADAGRGDAGEAPETGVVFNATTCKGCNDCAPELCLRNGNNERFCADRCDDDTTGCVTGFNCLNLGDMMNPQFYCISPLASCLGPAVGEGSACYGDTSSCLAKQNFCEGDIYTLGYCTSTCDSDATCAPGWTCLGGDDGSSICRPKWLTNAESCGRVGDPDEIPCAVDEDCTDNFGEGFECVRSDFTLPGICAQSCETNSCAFGTCLDTPRGKNCLTDRCACQGTSIENGARDLLGEALESVGISRCGTMWRVFDWSLVPNDVRTDPYRFSYYDRVHDAPLGAPAWANDVVKTIDAKVDPGHDLAYDGARIVEDLADLIDRPVTHRMPDLLDPNEPLATAVAALITEAGGTPDVPALRAAAASVPMDLQLAVATVVEAIERADFARKEALGASAGQLTNLYEYGPAFVVQRADGRGLNPATPGTQRLFNEQFQYGAMYGGAADLLDAISVADLPRFAIATTTTVATAPATLLFSADTPLGRIAIGDGESGIYDPANMGFDGAWALLVDLGGADDYRVPVGGNISAANSVSVVIDLLGDDRYAYVEVPHPLDGTRLPSDEGGRYTPRATPDMDNGPISLSQTPRQGGGRMGTAISVDLGGGKDRYRSLRMSQGAGIFGTGVLIDDGGDDLYEAEAMAQGAGSFGIGLLLDGGGNDEHHAYTMAQGFGFARGAGLAYDVAGDDQWLMDPGDPMFGGDPLYFNGQRPGRANTTLGQGWGFGRRADATDRAFMSGGLGILIDRTGGDTYRGSIFTQGGGFWFGTGILADEHGDDSYDGLWYAMGAGAHYSLGFLLEGEGNDHYGGELPKINVTIGGGHDYSAAFLIDESGDDVYQGSRITVGCGNSNGMGFFADNDGNDTYSAEATFSFGSAGLVGSDVDFEGSARRRVNVVGVFLDAKGHDTYARMGMSIAGFEDDQSWTQTVNTSSVVNLIERGAGVDGTGETSLHARF